jgi:predicted dienelactone hydrolase
MAPVTAAELLELRLDGLTIPLQLEPLERWSQTMPLRPRGDAESPAALESSAGSSADLAVWLGLLQPERRSDLMRLLRAPLLRDRSFGRQLLDSWAGGQLLVEVGMLLTTPEGRSTTPLLQSTLRRLLAEQREVTTLSLLRALPPQRLSLQLDGLLAVAETWRRQLGLQRRALEQVQALDLPPRDSRFLGEVAGGAGSVPQPRRQWLAVPHRREPLLLDLWAASPRLGSPPSPRPWVLLLPGLGGNADQLGWLAGVLAQRGWSVAVLQHPGSDGAALKAAIDGRQPPPGAETLAERLADVEAVLAARRRSQLDLPEADGLVLMGHSLGGVAALLAAGVQPREGLEERCRRAIGRLPIGNPSRLLQCQLPLSGVPRALARPADLRGVVLLNSFGSLLWPDGALGSLPVPVLMVGGSLDLVTPPLEEQLRLFLGPRDPRSRLVLVEGGSHFSPVRMSDSEEVVFRLGSELVGADPVTVQAMLLSLSDDFLQSLERPLLLPSQVRRQQGVTAYVLDPAAARRWWTRLKRWSPRPSNPGP